MMQVLLIEGPFGLKKIDSLSPGLKVVELRFNYSKQIAHETLQTLGEAGRSVYIKFISIDFVYIAVYVFFFMLCIKAVIHYFFPNNIPLEYLLLLPLISGLLDIAENVLNLIQTIKYPHEVMGIFVISNMVTMSKMISGFICYLIIGIGFLGFIISMIIKK